MRKKSILVVEDTPEVSVVLQLQLESDGYIVFTTGHGREALDLIAKTDPPDLIILDWVMPVMSGEDFLKILKQDPLLARVPIMLYSATEGGVEGVCCSLKKPADKKELLACVKSCIKN